MHLPPHTVDIVVDHGEGDDDGEDGDAAECDGSIAYHAIGLKYLRSWKKREMAYLDLDGVRLHVTAGHLSAGRLLFLPRTESDRPGHFFAADEPLTSTLSSSKKCNRPSHGYLAALGRNRYRGMRGTIMFC